MTPKLFKTAAPLHGEGVDLSPVSRYHRDRVRSYLLKSVLPQSRQMSILNLGCGTGNDAMWLASLGHRVLAVDDCPEKLAEAKSRPLKEADQIQFAELDVNSCSADSFTSEFDLLLCGSEVVNRSAPEGLRRLAVAATSWVRPGGRALLVTTSRTPTRIPVNDAPLWFHEPREIAQYFSPAFVAIRLRTLTVVMPEPHYSGNLNNRPGRLATLGAVDKLLAALPGIHHVARSIALDLGKRDAKTVKTGWERQSWHSNAPAPAASFQATPREISRAPLQSTRSDMDL